MPDIPLRCTCGTVRGIARAAGPSTGVRLICYCDDCQSFAHYLQRAPELLDPHGGTDVFQFTPARITFTEGSEALRCMRLGPKGPLRWYTDCCKTPVANTFAHRPSPFFDDDGEPICVPTVLTLDERSALRAQAESPPR